MMNKHVIDYKITSYAKVDTHVKTYFSPGFRSFKFCSLGACLHSETNDTPELHFPMSTNISLHS